MDWPICYFCETEVKDTEGFEECGVWVHDKCEHLLGKNESGYCSCDCILSGGHCDGSC